MAGGGWTNSIQVKAHTRRIKRPRWRPLCQCPEAREAVAAAPPRLFPGTPYGITVWAWFLVHVYAHYRPQRAAARELGTFGPPIAAGTLTGHQEDFLRLLQPLEQEIAR